ncbi:MAG: hypothetical protein EOS78_00935 [Mesorhizobium sp.]|nr:MAG: hypothetical protein EOS78_00935 [Mesorhizobium sp.]
MTDRNDRAELDGAQFTGKALSRRPGQAGDLGGERQRRFAEFQSLRCRLAAMHFADEQLLPECSFELRHLPREVRLADAELTCRAPYRACADHSVEIAEHCHRNGILRCPCKHAAGLGWLFTGDLGNASEDLG